MPADKSALSDPEIMSSVRQSVPLPLFPRAAFDLEAIAASAGGVPALQHIVRLLPVTLATPVAIVQQEESDPVNHVRPAADGLFATAAEHLGPRLLCVVLGRRHAA